MEREKERQKDRMLREVILNNNYNNINSGTTGEFSKKSNKEKADVIHAMKKYFGFQVGDYVNLYDEEIKGNRRAMVSVVIPS